MPIPPTPSKIARPTPSTPKHALSLASASGSSGSAPPFRSTTLSLVPPSTKKYKAALSNEARPRTMSQPASPTKRESMRPKTPTTPRRGAQSPAPMVVSEMDVSRVDPEEVLVDFENVEAGDISLDLEQVQLERDYGQEDKVLVSIRLV